LSPDQAPESREAWLSAVLDAERRGELLLAFDLVERALVEHPGDVGLQYRAVLALARSGSTTEAARRFEEYELGAVRDEDTEALWARIKKDAALAADGDERRQLALEAAGEYRTIYEQTGGYYPAVNAATLSFFAGDREAAATLAGEALRAVSESGEDSYYSLATEAEAYLLRGDTERAKDALERAARANAGDFGALATTRRQLRMICLTAGIDTDILAAVAGPAVVHFCGHRISDDANAAFRSDAEHEVARGIDAALEHHNVGFAYGSLASGADILWAEAFLARGVELHVVLPFALAEFVECSVAPSGGNWIERFNRCIEQAASVTYGTIDAYLGDDVLFGYCSEIAVGLTLVRARYLDAEVHQFAVWDGKPARGDAGTAIDVALWKSTGNAVTIVAPPVIEDLPVAHQPSAAEATIAVGDERVHAPKPGTAAAMATIDDSFAGLTLALSGTPDEADAPSPRPRRLVRAMLFADVRGFSKLTDEQLPAFAEYVFASFADVLARHRAVVEYSNTWGDAIYAVITDAVSAAACALDLQDAIECLDPESVGLPADLALRLGGHVGPIFPVTDPILNRQSFVGSHVNRTARIEPVTPPGAVYVTSPFAAALELAGATSFACDYVGQRPAAKDFGVLRMYRLRRANPAAFG
jgi:class 3 adenylate cyclase/tetratricopeptide (TPR) repeat protein